MNETWLHIAITGVCKWVQTPRFLPRGTDAIILGCGLDIMFLNIFALILKLLVFIYDSVAVLYVCESVSVL